MQVSGFFSGTVKLKFYSFKALVDYSIVNQNK